MKRHPILILALLAASLLGSFVPPATAQAASTRSTPCDPATPTNAICVGWTAVTTRVDGLPTIFPVTYRVEQQIGSGAFATAATVTTSQAYIKNLSPGDYTFRVFAIENQKVSAPSNTTSRTIDQAAPNAPVIVIAATIRAGQPPVYRIIQSVTLKPNEVVFVAPASMRPLFASR